MSVLSFLVTSFVLFEVGRTMCPRVKSIPLDVGALSGQWYEVGATSHRGSEGTCISANISFYSDNLHGKKCSFSIFSLKKILKTT